MLNERLILEEKATNLIVEALDEKTLQTANNIITKLRKIKGKGLKTLDFAIDEAEKQLNKYTGGGSITKAIGKIKSLVGIDNPLVKFMVFANALENGFKQFPLIINNATDVDLKANVDRTLGDLITDDAKRLQVAKNMQKALSPNGIFGSFKKIPFINKEDLMQELLTVPIKNIAAVLQAVTSGPNTQQVSDELKNNVTGKGEVETKDTIGSEPSKSTSGTIGSEPTKQTVGSDKTTPTGEKTQSQLSIANKIYDELSLQLIDAAGNESKAKMILKILADEEKLKL